MTATRETLVDSLTRQISAKIVDGSLPPGSRLDELTLAGRFGVSRTPVREALGRLSAGGLVERRPHRGVVVANVPQERLMHLFELMTELEGLCARLAADRMDTLARSDLVAIHDQTRAVADSGDIDAYATLNRRFHLAVYDGARNPVLVETTRDIRTRLAPFRRAQFNLSGRLKLSHAEHDMVVRAILARDGAAAAEAMRAHIAIVRDAYRIFAALGDGVGNGAAAAADGGDGLGADSPDI